MSKLKIAHIKRAVMEELTDIFKELFGVQFNASTDTRLGDMISIANLLSTFVNNDKTFTKEEQEEFREGKEIVKEKLVLMSGLDQLNRFWEDNNIPEAGKLRFINTLSKIIQVERVDPLNEYNHESRVERADFLNEQMHKLLIGEEKIGEERPLHKAVKTRSVKEVKKALYELTKSMGNIDALDENDHSALVLAVKLFHENAHADDVDIIKMLLKAGANPNDYWDHQGENLLTALLYDSYESRQISTEKVEVIQSLIEYGANPNFFIWGGSHGRAKYGLFALQLAVNLQPVEIAKNLIKHGAFVNSRNIANDKYSEDALYTALGNDDIAMVKMLLRYGADIEYRVDNLSTHEEIIMNLGNAELIKEVKDARERVGAAAELIINIYDNQDKALELFNNFSYKENLKQFRYPVYKDSNKIAESLLSSVMAQNHKFEWSDQAEEMINFVYDNFIDKFLENCKGGELKDEDLAVVQIGASSGVFEGTTEI